MDLAS